MEKNNKKRKVSKNQRFAQVICLVLALIMILSVAMPAFAAEGDEQAGQEVMSHWVQVGDKYKYKLKSGEYAKSSWIKRITDDGTEKWYVDAQGNMIENNWCQVDGQWFVFGADGKVTNKQWIQRKDGAWIYSDGDGVLTSDWRVIKGKDYFFENGVMLTGWVEEADTYYYLLDSGEKAYGWIKAGENWYYMDPNNGGKMATGERTIGGKRYLFDYISGAMRDR